MNPVVDEQIAGRADSVDLSSYRVGDVSDKRSGR
jgi:hypothetical protein